MSKSICPQCGSALPADSPQGVCPKCLIGLGLSSRFDETEAAEATPAVRFRAPAPRELAEFFPQLEIIELIGQGGMGAVYKARQRGLDRLVALKILPPDAGQDPAFAERFAREARALARLNHPNIVSVYDSGQAGGLYFFLMEFVDGVNLRQAIRTQKLSPQEALAIVPQICDALQFAHDAGVVHRDIKPENVLLDKQGRVKIADFGLARLLRQADDLTLTGTNQVMGTPRYMAPEQLEGAHAVDHRADIYSLGVVFYEMLTGELPLGRFAAPSHKVRIDVRLDDVVLRTLEKEPERRYQRASELKTDVQSIGELGAWAASRPRQQGTAAVWSENHWRSAQGFEYRSRTEWFGWPLVHVATGIDPETGKRKVAKGIIAIGDMAVGGVAIGGMAVGGVAMGGAAVGGLAVGGGALGALAVGGLTLGLFTVAGVSLGLLLAVGGMAIGAGLSVGGLAIGNIAVGGVAAGTYAFAGSGAAYGIYTWDRQGVHPEAKRMSELILENLPLLVPCGIALVLLITACIAVLVTLRLLRRSKSAETPHEDPYMKAPRFEPYEHQRGPGAAGCLVMLLVFIVAVLGSLGIYLAIGANARSMQRVQAEMVAREEAARAKALAQRAVAQDAEAADVTGDAGGEMLFGAVSPVWIRLSDSGPQLVHRDAAGQALTEEQVARIDQTLQDAYRDYLALEARSSTRATNDEGRQVVTVRLPSREMAELEDRLWAELDAVLPNVEWQEVARTNWRFFQLPMQGGMAMGMGQFTRQGSNLFMPFSNGELTIELWKVGRWFHWNVSGPTIAIGRGPRLPTELERFWREQGAEQDAPTDASGNPDGNSP